MKNSIKAAMLLNAIKNIKVAAKSGGKGSFSMKGFSFSSRDRDIAILKEGDVVLESLHRAGVDVKIASIELAWDFPMGCVDFEDGRLQFGSEGDMSLSFSLQGIKVVGKDEVFELEEISLEGVQQVQEFFLSLPLEDMAKLAGL